MVDRAHGLPGEEIRGGDGDGLIAAGPGLGEDEVLTIVSSDHAGHDPWIAGCGIDAVPDGAQRLIAFADGDLERTATRSEGQRAGADRGVGCEGPRNQFLGARQLDDLDAVIADVGPRGRSRREQIGLRGRGLEPAEEVGRVGAASVGGKRSHQEI